MLSPEPFPGVFHSRDISTNYSTSLTQSNAALGSIGYSLLNERRGEERRERCLSRLSRERELKIITKYHESDVRNHLQSVFMTVITFNNLYYIFYLKFGVLNKRQLYRK